MYIEKLVDENIGPIGQINIVFPFEDDGRPKPVVFVGENGSGKSTLLSNIIDALYSIAAIQFQNAMQPSDNGGGHQYYKVIVPTEIKVGNEYMFSYILFKNSVPIHYVFKCGQLTTVAFREKCPNGNEIPITWQDEMNFKNVNATQKDVEKIFQTDVICCFGPDRYEKPMWMGSKYFTPDDPLGSVEILHPSVSANWNGVLKNPITIKNVTEINLQWLMDVIVDSHLMLKARLISYELQISTLLCWNGCVLLGSIWRK